MNTQKVASALNTISLAFGELAEALIEQPVAGGAAPPASPPSADLSPPEEREYADDPRPVAVDTQDYVLGRCPDHDRPWRAVPGGVSKRTGKSYSAFWSCIERDCKKRPVKAWADSHDPEAAAA